MVVFDFSKFSLLCEEIFMLSVDFHSHSLFSGCGLHSIVELLSYAKSVGLSALAITDHGTALGGHISSPFFDRLQNPVPGIRLLKGQESNVIDERGTIDFPMKFLKYTDILLVGLHPLLKPLPKKADYTDMLITALEKNPYIDIITHPNDEAFPVDYDRLAAAAKRLDMALEFNNSKVLYKRVPMEATEKLIIACKRAECRVAVNSDTHALHEIGLDNSIRPLMDKAGFPKDLVVNETTERAYAFIEERRKVKLAFCKDVIDRHFQMPINGIKR
jgi:putative hydrolase